MKTLLSIGTGPGMGYETALRFAREGFRVVLSARREDKIRAMAEYLKTQGYDADYLYVDASDIASINKLIATVEKDIGPIDVLHYNAAAMRNESISKQPQSTFISDLAVNIGGALASIQATLPEMEKRGTGTILLTGGGFALAPSADYLSLSIGKAGIRNLTLGLFESLKSKGIHIASVTVSALVSPESQEAKGAGEAFWQLYSQPENDWTAEVSFPR